MKVPRLLALTAALLLPGSAVAQSITVYINSSTTAATSGVAFPFHQAACQQALAGTLNTYNQFQMDWTVASTGVTYQAFWSSDPACDATTAADGGDTNIPISVTSTQNQITINGETILNQITGDANPCTTPANDLPNGTVYICITGNEVDGEVTDGTLDLTPFYIAFEYDMNPPAASSGVSVTAADSELDCSWSFPYTAPPVTTTDTGVIDDTGDNADHFIVYAQEDNTLSPSFQGTCSYGGSDGGEVEVDGGIIGSTVDPTGWPIQVTVPTPSSSDNSTAVTGLTNGHCYDVSIIAFYPDGTQGYPTPVFAAAPIEIFDYWRLYHSAGGADDGGLHCQSAGGGLIPLALAAALLLVLRRRRRRVR
jgi:uncharacterized protein (TIGR03382 family)